MDADTLPLLRKGAEVIARAVQARHQASVVVADSRARFRSLSGESDLDLPLLTSVLRGVSLCGDCLARKTGLPRGKVEEALARVHRTIEVTSGVGRCDGCLSKRVVSRFG